jgi:hypothetical protein
VCTLLRHCAPGFLAHRQLDDALGLTMDGRGRSAHGPEWPNALVGLGVADGNQGQAATFPSRPQCGVATAKEISYVKDGRSVRLGPRFR